MNELPEVVKQWLDKADENYLFAIVSLENTAFYSHICFHFQQASEQYLKAYIIAHNLGFRPIHNLIELHKTCQKHVSEASDLREACTYLNPFYIDTRYPVHWPTSYTQETAREAQKAAEYIKEWVHKNVRI